MYDIRKIPSTFEITLRVKCRKMRYGSNMSLQSFCHCVVHFYILIKASNVCHETS